VRLEAGLPLERRGNLRPGFPEYRLQKSPCARACHIAPLVLTVVVPDVHTNELDLRSLCMLAVATDGAFCDVYSAVDNRYQLDIQADWDGSRIDDPLHLIVLVLDGDVLVAEHRFTVPATAPEPCRKVVEFIACECRCRRVHLGLRLEEARQRFSP
jgi:hypothetical protein